MAATIRSFSGSNSDPREFIDDVELAAKYNEKEVTRAVGSEVSVSNFQNSMVDYIIATARKVDAEASLKLANDHHKVVEDRFKDVSLNYHETKLRTATANGFLDEAVSQVVNHSKNASEAANSASNSADETVKAALHAIDYARRTITAAKSVKKEALDKLRGDVDNADDDAKFLNRQEKATMFHKTGFELTNSADNIQNTKKAADAASQFADRAKKAAKVANTAARVAKDVVEDITTTIIESETTNEELEVAKRFFDTVTDYKDKADKTKNSAKTSRDSAKKSLKDASDHRSSIIKAGATLNADRSYIKDYNEAQASLDRAKEKVEEANNKLKAANSAVANSAPVVANSRLNTSIARAARVTEDSQAKKEEVCLSFFRNHLMAESKAWHSTLSRDVRGDWETLKTEFLQHFKTAM
ncbi:hypothetical protein F4678DRAFT_426658 [Xylaria arbuscula]|nr:hypothetical protein F4678DRAFT_426658 [Xylaria arbuscula]